MTSTPPLQASSMPLSLFVVLPASAHSNQPIASSRPSRPSPLVTRQSGSTIPSLGSLRKVPSSSAKQNLEETPEIDKVVNAGRRLSLAPGMGSGTQVETKTSFTKLDTVHSSPHQEPTTIFGEPATTATTESSPSSRPPVFGSQPTSGPRSGRRRPQTAAQSTLASRMTPIPRGSIAVPPGGGMLGSSKTRPGWEGDEMVGVLRGSGLEVTIIRHAAQLPSVLHPSSSSPQLGAFSQPSLTARPHSPSSHVTPVILVPLSDSPTIPSLSLLLQQGTTPTAVCFQQDLLDRAKRSEEEWLPSALQQIRQVTEMRDKAMTEGIMATPHTIDQPIILAYSANPALSSSMISACVTAGAAGVLKPPYDAETARFVRRMVRAAKEGRISSIVGLSTNANRRSSSPGGDDSALHKVILPPTALSMGGEHEGEKVLSGAFRAHRRGTSANLDHWTSAASAASTSGRQRESSAPTRKLSLQPAAVLPSSTSKNSVHSPVTAQTPLFPEHGDHEDHHFASLLVYNPSTEQRRRSVDVSGLGIALKRAQRAFENAKPSGQSARDPAHSLTAGQGVVNGHLRSMSMDVRQSEKTEGAQDNGEDSCSDTRLAELLSAMYYQTQLAIEVGMDDFDEFSTPISQKDRARLVDAIATWNFKPHNLSDIDLFRVACLLFEGLLHSEGLAELQLELGHINRLLFALRAIYHAPNPYHNYVHAIDVLQATYSFLIALGVAPPFSFIRDLRPDTPSWKRTSEESSPSLGPGSRRARQVFRPQDVFAILLAAMGHDAGHPGLSNAFMKNAKTPLSQVYDDKSVLENMHCMLIVQLIRKHGLGFLLNPCEIAKAQQAIPARRSFDAIGFRRVMYSSVLATDMSLHFVWMQNLQKYGEEISHASGVYGRSDIGPGQASDEAAEKDRIMIAQALIKCADISNPTRPIDVSEHWSTVLLKEWAVQASLETDLSLPVSVIASADAALQAKGQIGFIKLFTQPLFDAVSDVLPEMQHYADLCAGNQEIWESRSEAISMSDETVIVQPAVEDAAYDERFSTLFPLSLPVSLVEARNLEPGPMGANDGGSPVAATGNSSLPQTPMTTPRKTTLADGCTRHPESPSAKAMRAVYHANLLDQRHRLSSWTRGVPIPGLQANGTFGNLRRSSTPAALSTGGL